MQIFVSYKSIDRVLVDQLTSDLKDMGHDVWYDQELPGGQKWWDKILENILQCDLFVFALTPQSLKSYPCQLEYTYANALNKPIVPVELLEVGSYNLLPVVLQERQIIRYLTRDVDTYKKLLIAIRSTPPTDKLPDPLPKPPPVPISPLAPIRDQIDSPTLSQEQQVNILYQLKGFLRDKEYEDEARELLNRLSYHPMLFATVLKDIQRSLSTPIPSVIPALLRRKPPKPVSAPGDEDKDTSEADSSTGEGTFPAFQNKEDENILERVNVSFIGGMVIGYIGSYWTLGVTGASAEYLRNNNRWQLIITNQRLVFLPSTSKDDILEILLAEIGEIRKALKLADPAISIKTKSGKEYKFTLISKLGFGFGNRDNIINLIQSLMQV